MEYIFIKLESKIENIKKEIVIEMQIRALLGPNFFSGT
tara:strand:+ start:582 stop:695 length:114 start_codon:yes stop_codon:yes gene_type:complete